MRFRTEIEQPRGSFKISHSDRILMLGSCFSDNIGAQLCADGFDVMVNPFGPLYNPVTLARLLAYLLDGKEFTEDDFVRDSTGVSHCLDFAMRYQSRDAADLASSLNSEISALRSFFDSASVLCVTFGSSQVFVKDGDVVGNCHKFPSNLFSLADLDVDSIVSLWRPLLERITSLGKKLIITVSPIRHLAYGLHGSQLGKARLLLACDALTDLSDYFPSYEIMIDDLRDYRFYDSDMKHPSKVACDYIYEIFSRTYFSRLTAAQAAKARAESLRAAHRTIISDK